MRFKLDRGCCSNSMSFQATPILVNETLYIKSYNRVFALDPETQGKMGFRP